MTNHRQGPHDCNPQRQRAGSTCHWTVGPNSRDRGKEAPRAPRILMVCPISGSRGKEESSPSPPHRPDPPRRPQPPPDPPVPHLGRPSIMLLASGRGPPPPLRLAGKQFLNRIGGGPPTAAGSTTPGAADSIATNQDKQQAPKTKPIPSLPFLRHPHLGPRRAGSRLAGDVPASTKLPLPPALRRFASINTGRAPSSTRFCQKDPLGLPPRAHFAGRHQALSFSISPLPLRPPPRC